MSTSQRKNLKQVSPELIYPNPENPRIVFREDELEALLRSIDQVGIQVPLSVFEKVRQGKTRYALLDGERRWRCSMKLGLKEIPVIVEPEPSPLNNLLMMFNIHNVRVAWDLMAIAQKLARIRDLVKKERKIELSKKDLADLTGISTATIARCDELMGLPEKYQNLIWEELKKPKAEQRYTEDLFIEIRKATATIDKYVPNIRKEYSDPALLNKFFEKYKSNVEINRVDFRKISKIARGEGVGIAKNVVQNTIKKYITDPKYSATQAYKDSVADAYEDRTAGKKLKDALGAILEMEKTEIDTKTRSLLEKILKAIQKLL